jgi:hypothetical protein
MMHDESYCRDQSMLEADSTGFSQKRLQPVEKHHDLQESLL